MHFVEIQKSPQRHTLNNRTCLYMLQGFLRGQLHKYKILVTNKSELNML